MSTVYRCAHNTVHYNLYYSHCGLLLYVTLCCISCIPSKISTSSPQTHSCKLAQILEFSSPPFTVKLSVPLPPSCNAAPLIAKATTQLKEVTFRQPISRYQMLFGYPVSRSGLLNLQWPSKLVRIGRGNVGAMVKLSMSYQSIALTHSVKY